MDFMVLEFVIGCSKPVVPKALTAKLDDFLNPASFPARCGLNPD
jgi:hypothetical protein